MHTPKHYRVTNGQRAAVCGLMIAGVNFTQACAVAGVSRPRVKEVLPNDWEKPFRRPNIRWTGKTLEKVRLEYADSSTGIKVIAARYGVNPATISTLARRKGWPMRGRGHWGPRKRVLMTREQRRLFEKLRRNGIGMAEAHAVSAR